MPTKTSRAGAPHQWTTPKTASVQTRAWAGWARRSKTDTRDQVHDRGKSVTSSRDLA